MTSAKQHGSINLIFTTLLVLGLLATSSGLAQDRPALVEQMGWADTVLVNGNIVSMDDRSIVPDTVGNVYQAMAIKGKHIMALGTDQEMRRLAGSSTRIVDLDGRTTIPGLIQTHYHLFGTAARRYGPQYGFTDPSIQLSVTATTDVEGTAKAIRETVLNAIQAQNIPEDQWISVRVQDNKDNLPAL